MSILDTFKQPNKKFLEGAIAVGAGAGVIAGGAINNATANEVPTLEAHSKKPVSEYVEKNTRPTTPERVKEATGLDVDPSTIQPPEGHRYDSTNNSFVLDVGLPAQEAIDKVDPRYVDEVIKEESSKGLELNGREAPSDPILTTNTPPKSTEKIPVLEDLKKSKPGKTSSLKNTPPIEKLDDINYVENNSQLPSVESLAMKNDALGESLATIKNAITQIQNHPDNLKEHAIEVLKLGGLLTSLVTASLLNPSTVSAQDVSTHLETNDTSHQLSLTSEQLQKVQKGRLPHSILIGNSAPKKSSFNLQTIRHSADAQLSDLPLVKTSSNGRILREKSFRQPTSRKSSIHLNPGIKNARQWNINKSGSTSNIGSYDITSKGTISGGVTKHQDSEVGIGGVQLD